MNEVLHRIIIGINATLWNQLLIYLLVGAGTLFTLRTGCVQVRGMRAALGLMLRPGSQPGISPYQAFAIGVASRVGTGNIIGVAVALTLGGPGAIFWMWVVAILSMSSAFAEATLAQIFKIRAGPHGFRGGPGYYIHLGLGSRPFGLLFSVALIVAFGFVFNAVQAKSMAETLHTAFGWSPLLVGVGLAAVVGAVIFGGIGRVAPVAARLVPFNALLYLGLAGYVMCAHAAALPGVLRMIVDHAFGLGQAAGGLAGVAVQSALLNGIKRGLFSNEAGMGSAPNAAATASARHPAEQGLLQMLGVVFDTLVVCTATASLILLSGLYEPGAGMQGAALVHAAMNVHIGPWGSALFALTVTLFAFSAIIGNYAYAESNIQFICGRPIVLHLFRVGLLGMVIFGSVASLPLVWDLADSSAGIMAIINLVAILLLSRHACGAWRDYRRQRGCGVRAPVFDRHTLPGLSARLPKDVW
ncbi:sodium:alanine symporter family protein [Robbsia sp. Bb-Pol-6]|uniref:Sodium:alanine symporter family protein n=1 Tax=Robbsia betulipollinis TaxID=2981849 RepID=A0ABT3ZNJ1_9BURK|nr:sodium:alanine symporter family protein [Robbsia betulipollinis]MCY0388121.1 sodium:alanine symporter family protein [Robbsia betulipollinis]